MGTNWSTRKNIQQYHIHSYPSFSCVPWSSSMGVIFFFHNNGVWSSIPSWCEYIGQTEVLLCCDPWRFGWKSFWRARPSKPALRISSLVIKFHSWYTPQVMSMPAKWRRVVFSQLNRPSRGSFWESEQSWAHTRIILGLIQSASKLRTVGDSSHDCYTLWKTWIWNRQATAPKTSSRDLALKTPGLGISAIPISVVQPHNTEWT